VGIAMIASFALQKPGGLKIAETPIEKTMKL
jgi:hypothetical protein